MDSITNCNINRNNFMNYNYQNIKNNNCSQNNQNMMNQMMANQMILNPMTMLPLKSYNNSINPLININIMNFKNMNNNNNNYINNSMMMNNIIINNNTNNNNNMNLNRINEDNLNNDYINMDILDKTKKELLNKIIKFFHDNNNDNMNFDNKIQIESLLNNLNPNYQGLNLELEIRDPLPYMKETKKIINFVNSDYNIIKVKIPNSITKLEFYSIAGLYKVVYNSQYLLIHNNLILKRDESSISEINEEDFVIIIENRNYPDQSYYTFLQKKYQNDKIINIFFDIENEQKKNLILSVNTLICETIKAFYLRYGFDQMKYIFIYNGKKLSPHDERKLKEIFQYGTNNIISCETIKLLVNNNSFKGKTIIGRTSINGEISEIKIGTLNSVENLINFFQSKYKIELKKIYVNKIEIKKDDDNSLSSFGIKEDFNLLLEYKTIKSK